MPPIVVAAVALLLFARRASAEGSSMFLRPVNGRVSSPFGPRTHPITGEPDRFHNGIDLAVPVGTPVLAPATGKVVRVWSDELNGNALRLEAGGYTFGFAHLSAAKASVGQLVERGQVVALSGNTGSSKGPHVHLTVRDARGELVDPQTLFGGTAGV